MAFELRPDNVPGSFKVEIMDRLQQSHEDGDRCQEIQSKLGASWARFFFSFLFWISLSGSGKEKRFLKGDQVKEELLTTS